MSVDILGTNCDQCLGMVQCCLTSTETIRLIRDGEKGGYGGGGGGKREIIYLSLHCHHQNDSCIKMGSDESPFNVSVGSDGQSPQATTFLQRKESRSGIEPRSFRLPALSPFLIGRMFLREPSWKYSAKLVGS